MRSFTYHPKMRVAALCVFAYGAIARGLAYIDAPSTGLTTFVDKLVPLTVWAIVWITAGVLIFAGVWHRIIARWAMALGSSLWLVWGLSYMWATVIGDQSRGWVTGAAMLTLGGAMLISGALMDSEGPPPVPVIPPEEAR